MRKKKLLMRTGYCEFYEMRNINVSITNHPPLIIWILNICVTSVCINGINIRMNILFKMNGMNDKWLFHNILHINTYRNQLGQHVTSSPAHIFTIRGRPKRFLGSMDRVITQAPGWAFDLLLRIQKLGRVFKRLCRVF